MGIHRILATALLCSASTTYAATPALKNGPTFCSEVAGAECISADGFTGQYKGIKFSLHSDGSGVVQSADGSSGDYLTSWRLGCGKSGISGAKSCTVSIKDLRVYVQPNGVIRVYVGDEHYPGSQTSIRVGNKVFHTTTENAFSSSKQITALMTDGSEVVTKYVTWPDRTADEKEMQIYGFQVALQIATWSVKNLK